jgi:hypothetical protein
MSTTRHNTVMQSSTLQMGERNHAHKRNGNLTIFCSRNNSWVVVLVAAIGVSYGIVANTYLCGNWFNVNNQMKHFNVR